MGRDPPKELPVERPDVSCGSGESPSGSGPACWRKALPSESAELLAKTASKSTGVIIELSPISPASASACAPTNQNRF